MNSLRLCKYRFTLRFTSDTKLPFFMGNTIRGALGRVLGEAAYNGMFKVASDVSIPNPFAVSVPYPSLRQYSKGSKLDFFITLFANACDFLPDVITAAQNMCRGKFANCVLDGGELVYERIWSDSGAETIPYCDMLTIRFVTPAEILNSKQLIKELPFAGFTESLFGRIAGIIDNYTESKFIIPYSLIALKPHIRADYNLKEIRFETSGQTINGVTGTVRYLGDVTPYLPYIDLGSQIHIGKKTTRGCGEFVFEI
ncbi:MAG: CRISPR system precrRNA processing endoribonuclease RAMP protein Cas6 [Clostridiales bacterium]|jgi:hypothetical protein|nr:CRISPR system precrRNA processing endoribonuclease RAMP protein Cas6 [Clostridiales bacterium]